MVITPDAVSAFMENLSARKLFGVGPVMEKKLAQLGVKTCGGLQKLPEEALKDMTPEAFDRMERARSLRDNLDNKYKFNRG